MSEEQGGQGGGAGAGAGELGGGGAAPDWMASLPDDLKGDATLARFPDVEKLARGAIDLKRQASSRVIVPGEGASEADFNAFYSAIGRPETPDKYEFGETIDAPTADAFRPVAHKIGLTGAQAKALADFDVERVTAAQNDWLAKSKAEIDAVKGETPDYDAKIASAKQLFKDLGGTPEIAQELDLKLGSGSLIKFFLGLADKAGEARRIDGDAGDRGGGGGEDPDAALSTKMKDATWRERAKVAGTPEHTEYKRLEQAATQKEQRSRQGSAQR